MSLAYLRRNLFEPLQLGLSGSPRLSYWRTLEKTQWYPRERLEEIQWRRLQELWRFLWERNPFYRERFERAGLAPESLRAPADLALVPLLSKKEIRKEADRLLSLGHPKEALMHFKTGGSTGKALDIFLTEACSELRNACARRHDRWCGWEPGEPVGAAWGNPKLPAGWKARLKEFLVQPYLYLDTIAVSDASVLEFARSWRRLRPTMLFGHAHSLFVLAQTVKRLGITGIRPRGILSTSMMLLPHERAVIEEVFGVKVTDRYGCEEVSLIGSECERHQGLHMNVEHLYIEFLRDDGSAAAPGEVAHIVVTDLMNLAMPLVRYRVEDKGCYLSGACPCGRGLPLMGNVSGRVADFLLQKDGTRVAGISLIENTLTAIPGLDQLQIVQESRDLVRLNVVPGGGFTPGALERLEGYLGELLGGGITMETRLVSEIAPEPSGKYRFSICRIPDEGQP